MSRQARDAVWEHSKASGSALLVLLCLAEHANENKGHKSWPSIGRIARRTRLTERQVQRHLKALQASGELHEKLQTGPSRTNEYWLLLPGMPAPPQGDGKGMANASKGLAGARKCLASATKGLEGDILGQGRVTSKATKGDIDDTPTVIGEKKENQEVPLNPPKREEVSDSDYWMKLLTEFKGLVLEHASVRERKAMKKRATFPPREQGQALMRYLRAAPPERLDTSAEAQLLRCRKRKLSSLIRHLPEMCANAVRHDKLVHSEKYRPKPPPPPPAPRWDWRALAIDMYASHEPPYDGRNAEMRARLEQISWEGLDDTVRRDIHREYERRDDEKKKEAGGEGRS